MKNIEKKSKFIKRQRRRPGKKVPTRQSLNEEYHRLLSGKKEAYAEYRQVKKDMQEYLIAKQTVEHILGIDRKNRIITQQQNLD